MTYPYNDNLIDLLNRSAADMIDERNNPLQVRVHQQAMREAIAIHLGRSTLNLDLGDDQ